MTKKKPKIPKDSEVIELINSRVLVSHAVTLAPEGYIKKSVSDFLTSYLLLNLGIVTVNENPKNLEASMLAASFGHPEDLALLLHGCISSTSGIKLTTTQEDKLSVEEKNRHKIQEQLNACSLESIIEHVKDSMGQPRITYISPTKDLGVAVVAQHNAKADTIGSYIRVTKPAEIDYRKLDFSHIKTDAALDVFLKDIIKYESGITDRLDIAIELFDPIVGKLFDKMQDWQELAIKEAKSSKFNTIQFEVVKDPWAALANEL